MPDVGERCTRSEEDVASATKEEKYVYTGKWLTENVIRSACQFQRKQNSRAHEDPASYPEPSYVDILEQPEKVNKVDSATIADPTDEATGKRKQNTRPLRARYVAPTATPAGRVGVTSSSSSPVCSQLSDYGTTQGGENGPPRVTILKAAHSVGSAPSDIYRLVRDSASHDQNNDAPQRVSSNTSSSQTTLRRRHSVEDTTAQKDEKETFCGNRDARRRSDDNAEKIAKLQQEVITLKLEMSALGTRLREAQVDRDRYKYNVNRLEKQLDDILSRSVMPRMQLNTHAQGVPNGGPFQYGQMTTGGATDHRRYSAPLPLSINTSIPPPPMPSTPPPPPAPRQPTLPSDPLTAEFQQQLWRERQEAVMRGVDAGYDDIPLPNQSTPGGSVPSSYHPYNYYCANLSIQKAGGDDGNLVQFGGRVPTLSSSRSQPPPSAELAISRLQDALRRHQVVIGPTTDSPAPSDPTSASPAGNTSADSPSRPLNSTSTDQEISGSPSEREKVRGTMGSPGGSAESRAVGSGANQDGQRGGRPRNFGRGWSRSGRSVGRGPGLDRCWRTANGVL